MLLLPPEGATRRERGSSLTLGLVGYGHPMSSPYPIYDVTQWVIVDIEPEGDDVKYWLLGAAGESTEEPWLFKQATLKELDTKGGGKTSYRQGEDWAEKIAAELAALMGLPAARVELATRDGHPGLLSRDTRPPEWSLNGGGVRIAEIDPRYRPKTAEDRRSNRVGHSLENIATVLNAVEPCPGFSLPPDFTSWDIFAGYLLFDAWIANRDRHEHNWALMRDPQGGVYLSPSFDHAAALASGLVDSKRQQLIDQDGLRDWCRAGTAHRFEGCGDVSLLTVASRAFRTASAAAQAHWVSNVLSITETEWQTVLNRVGFLSEVTRTFTSEVLLINQERIRDEFRHSVGC